MWGVPTAGTITKSLILRRRGAPYLKIWCRYSRQNGRVRTVRRIFSLYGHTDEGASILQKIQTNTTVLYDPVNFWLASLYPLEAFMVQTPSVSYTANKSGPIF